MGVRGEPLIILLVEDDPAHAEITKRNLREARVANTLVHVSDGEAALDYLHQRGPFAGPPMARRPDLVLLDLRLPKIDGIEVLKHIKNDATLKQIPVVILTTSSAETDIVRAYENYTSSYLVKPVDFEKLSAMMEAFGYYWLAWNRYPDPKEK